MILETQITSERPQITPKLPKIMRSMIYDDVGEKDDDNNGPFVLSCHAFPQDKQSWRGDQAACSCL